MDKTVCELFAGVGGFRVGLERAGDWDVVWANQWEPSQKSQHAFECYSTHFEGRGIHSNRDITSIQSTEIPKCTLLVGGFPCQDYSVARTQATGIHGKKGVLFWEIKRILQEKEPPFILLENVDRLLKSPGNQRGRDFAIMLYSLWELGYAVEWRVINAADYGFPQRRRRVFIFAFKNSTEYYKKLFSYTLKEWIYKKGFFQDEFPIKVHSHPKHGVVECRLDSDIIKISDNFRFTFRNSGVMNRGYIYSEETIPEEFEPRTLGSILESNVDERYYLGDDLMKWEFMKGAKRIERISKNGHKYFYSEGGMAFPDPLDKPSRTMLTSEASTNRSTHVVRDPENLRLRLLTPVECERLNGFDDDWTNTGMPHNFRYFCMGNALVVGLIEKMGRTLNVIAENEQRGSSYGEQIENVS